MAAFCGPETRRHLLALSSHNLLPPQTPEGEARPPLCRHHTDLPLLPNELGTPAHPKPALRAGSPWEQNCLQTTSGKGAGRTRHLAPFIFFFFLTFDMYIGFLFLNTKTRCLLHSVPTRALCADLFLDDNAEGENRGSSHENLLEISLRQPSPPPPLPPIQGKEVLLFSPHFSLHMYTADKIFHFTPSPHGTCRLMGKGFV